MTSSSLEETTTRNYLLMSKMKKEADRKYCPCIAKRKKNDPWLTQSCTVHVWPKQNKNDHWLTQSDHWVTVISPELQTSKAVITAVLVFHFNVIL